MAPPENERRGGPRIEVYAQANVVQGGEVYLMSIRNLSSGGVYLEGTPDEYPELGPGVQIELTLFGSEDGMGDDEELNIHCTGRITRIDPGFEGKRPPGFGVTIEPRDDDQRERLLKLMARAQGFTVKNRSY